MPDKNTRKYMQETMPTLIFTTLALLVIVFGSFFYYVCSLDDGCLYKGYFMIFFSVAFILFLLMVRVEKSKIKAHYKKFSLKLKHKKKIIKKTPFEKILHKLNALKHNFKKNGPAASKNEFCIIFKDLVSKIIQQDGNFTYKELIEKVNGSGISVKLRQDIDKMLSFLDGLQYRDEKITISELKSLINYSITLTKRFNIHLDEPKVKHQIKEIQFRSKSLFHTIPEIKFPNKKIISVLLVIVLFAGSLAVFGGEITGFAFKLAEGTSGSVTIFTLTDQSVVEGHTTVLSIYANDSDEENIIFDVGENDPDWVAIATVSNVTTSGVNATGTLTITPPSTGYVADEYSVTVIARSTDNDAASEAIYINVTDNVAPSAHTIIPNVTWEEDTNDTSLDLDDYFNDTEADDLDYTYSGNNFISISISSEGIVTLSAEQNWFGNESVTFTATDDIDTNTSNEVVLNITNVYDPLSVENISIMPSSPSNISDLNCSWYIADEDSTANLTAELYWYKSNGTDFILNLTETDIICTSNSDCYGSVVISYAYTAISDVWNCTVNATDQSNYSFNSAQVNITAKAPELVFFDSTSDDYNRTSVGSDVYFSVIWSDIDSTNVTMHVCSNSSVNISGCDGTTFCSSNEDTSSTIECAYTTSLTDNVNTTFWSFVCDDVLCSTGNESMFYMNQKPSMLFSDENISFEDGAVICAGEFDEEGCLNQQSYLKFDGSALQDYTRMNITNSDMYITVTNIEGNWSGDLIFYLVTNETWTSSDTVSGIANMTLGSSTLFEVINNTTTHNMDITTLMREAAMSYNQSNISFKIYEPNASGIINDSRSNGTYFAVGDNDSSSNIGEMWFNSSPEIYANITNYIQDYSWNMNTAQVGPDLDDYFTDPDGYVLNYTVAGNENIAVVINETTNIVLFTPDPGWAGSEDVIFTTYDVVGENTSSNTVTLTVITVSGSTTSPTVSTSSSSSRTTERISVEITAQDIEMHPIDAKVHSMIVSNTGEVSLDEIALDYLFPNIESFSGDISENYISSLAEGENQTINIELKTLGVEPGNYNVSLSAIVGTPSGVTDTEVFTIRIKDDADWRSIFDRIKFVEDLFKTNPECLEYLEYVTASQKFVGSGDIKSAHEILNKYVDECKDRIKDGKTLSFNFRGNILDKNKILIVVALAAVSMLYVASLYIHRT